MSLLKSVELEGYKNLRLIKSCRSVDNNISFNGVKGYMSFSYYEVKSKLSDRATSIFVVHKQAKGKDPDFQIPVQAFTFVNTFYV